MKQKRTLWIMTLILVALLLSYIGVYNHLERDIVRDLIHGLNLLLLTSFVTVAYREISKRNQMMKKLERRNSELLALFDKLPYGVILENNESQKMVYSNNWVKQVVPELSDAIDKASLQSILDIRSYDEKQLRLNDFDYTYYEGEYSQRDETLTIQVVEHIFNFFSEQPLTIYVLQDVTLLKRTQIERVRNEKMEAITQLSSAVAHDFNNQLMGISGHASLLLEKCETDNKEHLKKIIHATEVASDLVDKLISFSPRNSSFTTEFDLERVIKSAMEHFAYDHRKQFLYANMSGHKHLTLTGDKMAIESALINVFKNAFEAMDDAGKVTVKIDLIGINPITNKKFSNELLEGTYIRLQISDHGKGIATDIEKIYDPFVTTKPFGKGHGIGLTAVYNTIQNHFGGINAYPNEDVGMTFEIVLPLAIDQEQLGITNIGVIEDDDIVLDLLESALSAVYGVNAMFITPEDHVKPYQILITDRDIHPNLELYLVRAFGENPHLQIMVISGYFSDEDIKIMQKYERVYYLEKPLNINVFNELILRMRLR